MSPPAPLLSPQGWEPAAPALREPQHLLTSASISSCPCCWDPAPPQPQGQQSAFWNQFSALSLHKISKISCSVCLCSALRTWLLLRNANAKSGANSPDFLGLANDPPLQPRRWKGEVISGCFQKEMVGSASNQAKSKGKTGHHLQADCSKPQAQREIIHQLITTLLPLG